LQSQLITIIFSATLPQLFNMILQIDDFLLNDRVKQFYSVTTYQLNLLEKRSSWCGQRVVVGNIEGANNEIYFRAPWISHSSPEFSILHLSLCRE
jgi:hypothetical protein